MNNIVGIQSTDIYIFIYTYLFRWCQRLPCEVQCSWTEGTFFCLIVHRQGWICTLMAGRGLCGELWEVVALVSCLRRPMRAGALMFLSTCSALHSAWHSGGDQYIFIQATNKIILSRGENLNPKHVSLLSRASLSSLCFGKKPKHITGTKYFAPSSAFASTANVETHWPSPCFLRHGLYLQHSILKINVNVFSSFICLLSVVVAGVVVSGNTRQLNCTTLALLQKKRCG